MKIMSYVLSAALLVAITGMSASAAVHNWNFNEGSGSSAADSTGGTGAAVENGTTVWGVADVTKGTNQSTGVAHWNPGDGGGAFNTVDGQSFSAQVWVKFDALPTNERWLFGKANYNWGFTIQTKGDNDDQIRVNYYVEGIDLFQPLLMSVAHSDLNNWHHLGLIYDGVAQKMRTYHDGALLDVVNGHGSNRSGNQTTSLHINGTGSSGNVGFTMDHARYETSNIGDAGMLAGYNNGNNPDPIPEPATLGLLAAGGLLMLRRRSA